MTMTYTDTIQRLTDELDEQLNDAQGHADAGDAGEALASIREARRTLADLAFVLGV